MTTRTQYAGIGRFKTFKVRSARKLIAIGQALLAGKTEKPKWHKPSAEQVAAMSAIQDIEPIEYAGSWDGVVFTLGGSRGQFNMLTNAAQAMIAAGQITADGRLTPAAQDYLRDVDGYITPIKAA
ncbi:MAG: hypothetical protein L3J65_01010 [Robiginitomaculum sp.]|nr:hypothetical protein [Robiginitomaculum sp.]